MTTIVNKSKAKQYLQQLRNDPIFFVRELWKDRKLDSVAPLSDVEFDMIDFAYNGVNRRRGILGARGIGKTTMITATMTVYRGFRDPDRKILIVSKSATAAKEVIGLTREWLDNVWFLQHMVPRKGHSDTTNFYDFGTSKPGLSKQPSVKALGNDGQLEGNRAHTIIPDDAETKGNTKTQGARDELRRIFSEFRNILYPMRPGGGGIMLDPTEIVVVGTYKHEDSVYKTCAEKGYDMRTYPLAYPQKSDKILNLAPILQHKLASGLAQWTIDGRYDERPVFPLRFNDDDIRDKMAEGKHEFGMEHMLLSNLSDSNRYPLKLHDLIVHDCPRDQAPITIVWGSRNNKGETIFTGAPSLGIGNDRLHFPMAVDRVLAPYATTKAVLDIAGQGNDLTGVAIAGYLNGNIWVKHCRGWPGGADELTLNQIAQLLRQHGAREVHVETNIDLFDTYAPALEVQIKRLKLLPGQDPAFPDGWNCGVFTFRSMGNTGSKEERICNVLGPVLGSHRMVIDPSVARPAPHEADWQTFQYQLSRIQRVKKCLREDGAIDALASLVMKFQQMTAGIRSDPTANRKDVELRRARQWAEELKIKAGGYVEPARVFRRY